MKKTLIALLTLAVIGAIAYEQRTDIMLAMIKYKFSREVFAEPRELP